MDPIHELLKHQLDQHVGKAGEIPAGWSDLLRAVNETYLNFFAERQQLERSLAEKKQELLEANSEIRAVFQAIPDLMFRFDREGVILEVKAGATSDLLLGFEELSGKRIQDIPFKSVGEQFRAAMERVLAERAVVQFEYTLAQQGETFAYEARLAPVFENQVVAIVRNITKRKRAEDELFNSRQMLRTILDTIPQRVFWKDRNSIYVGGNKPFALDCGYKEPSEIVGRSDLETNSAEIAELYRKDDRHVMETGQPKLNYEEPQLAVDGSQRWLITSKTPLHDKDGNVVGVLGTYEDITERKRLEEQFRQSQKMEAFGQLAGGIAHDFNNLLTVIQGNLSFLQMGSLSKTEYTSVIGEIFRATERAANLTRQLLTFSRRQPIQSKDIDLNEVVTNMAKMFQRLIGEHIALQLQTTPERAPIHADPNMMEQALMNLVVNSRDAMPKGGRLSISTVTFVVDDVIAQTKPRAHPGTYVRLSVKDTGTGIAPEHLPHIFEPFYTTKGVGKGTGLGLATVFGIVEQHQGWIEVESQPNAGTTFHLYFPKLQSGPENVATRHVSDAEPCGGAETIMLVEDEREVRALMRRLLERSGYQVYTASSGLEALKLWHERRPKVDLLVTDMVMPGGIGGRELADRLRSDQPELKVLYCSGYTDEMLGTASPFRATANFLEKPFSVPVFLKRVRDCLDQRS